MIWQDGFCKMIYIKQERVDYDKTKLAKISSGLS